MANKGQSYGRCYNCWHFKFREDNRNCLKYDFVFPKSSFDIFCRDYRNRFLKTLATDHKAQAYVLIMGIPLLLFYIFTGGWFYGWKSRLWRKRLKASTLFFFEDQSRKPLQPLASFSELRSPTFLKNVTVKIDSVHGIHINFDTNDLVGVPDIDKDIEVDIDDKQIKFGYRGSSSVLYCLEPNRLSSWVDRPWAIFFAQPESKTYKLLPHYFR